RFAEASSRCRRFCEASLTEGNNLRRPSAISRRQLDYFLGGTAQNFRIVFGGSLGDQQHVACVFHHFAEVGLAHIEAAEQTLRRVYIAVFAGGDGSGGRFSQRRERLLAR